jgi:hypothetical protein
MCRVSPRSRKRHPPEKLKTFLTDPNPKMPDMNLLYSEIADVAHDIGVIDP